MGSYRPLFSIAVEHTYFTRDSGPEIGFVPTIGTHSLIEKTGLLVRGTRNGIRVFYDQNNLEALKLFADIRSHDIEPDVISYNATISACEKGGERKNAV